MQTRTAPETGPSQSARPVREIRQHIHRSWASVAEAWGEYADYADQRGADVTAKMLEISRPRPGDRVLELACGAGGLGFAAAKLVGPQGEVVLSDVAAEMTAVAAVRAATLGIRNVRTAELDLEDIQQPDSSYDVALCREGLMLALDPAHALREIQRVLKPGGRTALAVWGPKQRNPWLSLVFDAVSAQLGTPVPPPGIPGPFALQDADELGWLLRQAGFSDVEVCELPTPLKDTSFDEWFRRTTALAGPLANRLTGLTPDASKQLRRRLQDAVQPYSSAAGLEFPGLSLIASGRRP